MPVLPIAAEQNLGGVKLDPANDIVGAADGKISTTYNGSIFFADNSVVVGSGASSSAVTSGVKGTCVAVGATADAGFQSVAIGYMSKARVEGGIALGMNAAVIDGGAYSAALGYNATVSSNGSVALGYGALAQEANVVSVGNPNQFRKIVYVAAGENDTDAVNYKQFHDAIATIKNQDLVQQLSRLQVRIDVLERQLTLLMAQKG